MDTDVVLQMDVDGTVDVLLLLLLEMPEVVELQFLLEVVTVVLVW